MSRSETMNLITYTQNEFPESLSLSWRNLSVYCNRKIENNFWTRKKTERIQIIDSVNGMVESGNFVAILGPSGAGKTTLLAAISSRVRGDIQGSILLNGKVVPPSLVAKISGFVPQNDLAFEMLTVGEHMEFMARMKMDVHTDDASRKRRIMDLISQLGIQKCFNTTLQCLSGGERRRLSLAVQIINDPPLLFCDEPTTGLDSWAAASVIGQLRDLARAGKAIICSIHQPASGITDMFHQVILLAGGRVAFQGPVSEASLFFKELNFSCPFGYNEAEFLVTRISNEDNANKICSAWIEDDRSKRLNFYIDSKSEFINENADTASFLYCFPSKKPGMFIQLYWLIWRSFISGMRKKKTWMAEFISYIGVSLLLAVPFHSVLTEVDQTTIQNIQGLMSMIVTNTIYTFIYNGFYQFPSEIGILLRDVANDLYSPGPYYLARMLYLIPRATLETFIYTSLIFWIVGLKGGFDTLSLFIVPVIFAANSATAYGTWLSAAFESINTASLIAVPIDLVCSMFSGVYISLTSLPVFLYWLKYLSIFYYSSEAISILQWQGVDKITCDDRTGLPCINSGKEVLSYYGYETTNFQFDLLCMFAIYCSFHILGFIAILRRCKKQPVY